MSEGIIVPTGGAAAAAADMKQRHTNTRVPEKQTVCSTEQGHGGNVAKPYPDTHNAPIPKHSQ